MNEQISEQLTAIASTKLDSQTDMIIPRYRTNANKLSINNWIDTVRDMSITVRITNIRLEMKIILQA